MEQQSTTIQNFDQLQMLFGYGEYRINDHIAIRQPTVGEVMRLGEREYYGMLSAFTAVPSDMIGELWEKGIDWTNLSDFELFIMLSRGLTPDRTSILFGSEIDFSRFELCLNPQNEQLVLQDQNGIRIDINIYTKISEYLRSMHGIVPKREMPYNKLTKKVMIREAMDKLAISRRKSYKSMMYNMVSSMVNSAGFKYDYTSIQDLGIVAFTDAVKRISTITSANNLTLGAYMGNLDVKKINKNEFNWMRDLK